MNIKNIFIQFLKDNLKTSTSLSVINQHGLNGFMDSDSLEYKQQYLKNTILRSELQNLKNSTSASDFVLLKGMGLLELELYHSYGERSISDIDLLVFDIEKISNLLIRSGYQEVLSNKWKANNFKRVYSKIVAGHEVVFELHTRLFYHEGNLEYKFEETQNKYLILKKEDFLIHLVGHLAFQHTFIKLHWLLDILLFIDRFEIQLDQDRIQFLLQKLKLKRSWWWCLYFRKNIIQKEDIFFKLIFKSFLLFPEKSVVRYYLLKHFTKDTLLEALKYDYYWILQRGWKLNGT